MGVEKVRTKGEGGNVGGFFHLFDWTSKSRKKLFATKLDFPESSNHRRKVDGSLAMKQSYLMGVDEDEIGVGASIRGSSDHSYASSFVDYEVCGTRVPSVVARLMGLDSVPFSNFPDPNSTPYFDSQSLQEERYLRTNLDYQHDHQILYSGRLLEKVEGSSRNIMEPKPQKTPSRPIEKFQAEVMPPKSAKSIPVSHHKLLSPIKSPGFVPKNDAAYIMGVASRIIESGPHVTTAKAKTLMAASSQVTSTIRDLKEKVDASIKVPLVGSSSMTSRVRDSKEKQETSQRTCRVSGTSQRSVESNAAKNPKGQYLNKSWNGSVDRPARYTEAEEDSSLKNKEKSISLAIQAKMNVQRRESLGLNGGRSLVDQREHFDIESKLHQKENVQQSMHKKSCGQNASGVLRQNNLKQNCPIDKDKLQSKPLVSNSCSRKVQTEDSSNGRRRSSSSKSISKSRVEPKKSAMRVTSSEKEILNTRANNFPRKKRSTDRDWNDRVVDNMFIDKAQKPVQDNLASDKRYSSAEEVKKRDTDVVSFTFTTPLTGKSSGCEKSGQAGLKTNGSLDQHIKRVLLDADSTRSPVEQNKTGGDALGILLEQKLRELAFGVNVSTDGSFKVRPPSSTSPKSNDLVPTINSVNLITRLQQKKDQDKLFTDRFRSSRESDISITGVPELQSKHGLRVDEMEECNTSPVEAKSFDCRQPSPISVLEPSFSTESCKSSFRTDDTSTAGSNLCSSTQPHDFLSFSFSRKFHSAEADAELSDSACSTLTKTMVKKHTSEFSLINLGRSSTWKLDYVNDILCNVELMYMDYVLGRARNIVNPHLFNLLESRKGRSESDDGESKIRRKVIFDCVSECLDLRCRHYVGGGYKMWTKGIAMVRRSEWLAVEVYKEISSWRGMDDSMVDELVDRDMSSQHGRWRDFEVDTFELGAEIGDQIFNSLVDEVVSEILQL